MDCSICKQTKQPTKDNKYPCFPCDGCRFMICSECSGLSATELRCVPLASRLLKFHCSNCREYNVAKILQQQIEDKEQIIKDKMSIIEMLQEKIKMLEEEPKESYVAQSYADVTKMQNNTNKIDITNNFPNIIIKPKNAQTQEKTKDDLSQNIKPNQLNVGVKWMKTTNAGTVIIKCDSKQNTNKLKQEIESKLEPNYEVVLTKMRQPRIKITNFQQEMSKEDIEESIKKQNGIEGNIVVTYIKKTKLGSAIIFGECCPKSFGNIMRQGKIYIGWQRCPVYEDLEVPRCHNCQGFFHKKTNCTNKITCPKCGEEHDQAKCNTDKKHCCNCFMSNAKYKTKYDTNHHATDYQCPTLIFHKNNLRNKTTYTI